MLHNLIQSIHFDTHLLQDKDQLCQVFEICKKIWMENISPETKAELVQCEKRYMQSLIDVKVKLNKTVELRDIETEW